MAKSDLLWILRCAAALLAAALLVVLAWRSRNRARVGAVRLSVRPRRKARAALLVAAWLAAAALVAGSDVGRSLESLLVLALALGLLAANMGFQDSRWGERGVQRGWHARRYDELEGWRLIGEHVRWQLRGEWLATDVPPAEHAGLRAVLEAAAPGRESAHGNAGFDPQRAAAPRSNS